MYLESYFSTLNQRYQRLNVAVRSLNQNLLDVISALEKFQDLDSVLSADLGELSNLIGNNESSNTDELDLFSARLTSIWQGNWAKIKATANKMVEIPNVEDIQNISERVQFSLFKILIYMQIQIKIMILYTTIIHNLVFSNFRFS